MKDKLLNALVENRSTRTFGQKIGKHIKNLWRYVDAALGRIARFYISKTTKLANNRVMFFTNQGSYACNPRAIHAALVEKLGRVGRLGQYDLVWSYLEKSMANKKIPNCRMVVRHSLGHVRAMASAKIIITNGEGFLVRRTRKNAGQIVLNTWHGSLGFKRFGPESVKTQSVEQLCRLSETYVDVNISNSTFEDDVFRSTYWPNTEIWKFGHARNDILVLNDEDKRRALKENLLIEQLQYEFNMSQDCGIEEQLQNIKICLYAPTFRDSEAMDSYNIHYGLLIEALQRRFGGKWLVFTRLHPRLTKKKKAMKLADNDTIFDLAHYPDIQDLMLVADAMITDYSSCILDYMLTRRPGFIFATDIEQYNTERGFYYSLYDTPFPVAVSNVELLRNIENFEEPRYVEAVNAFLEEKGCMDDGHAAERTADKIIEILESQK